MGKKLLVMLMSLSLFFTSVFPVFAADRAEVCGADSQVEEVVDEEEKAAPAEEATDDAGKIEENAVSDDKLLVDGEEDSSKAMKASSNTESTTEDLLPKVTSYEATSSELQTIHVTWALENADRVDISISSDRSMQGVTPVSVHDTNEYTMTLSDKDKWKTTYVRLVPYNGQQAGQLVEFGVDIFDEYKPDSVVVKDNVFTYEDGVKMPVIIVKDKKGRQIPSSCMKQLKVSSKYPGKNMMTIRYTGEYAGLPDFDIPYTLLPGKPEKFKSWWTTKTSIDFMVSLPRQYYSDALQYADYCVVEWSKSSDFSNATSITLTKDSSDKKKKLQNLTKNTKYYLRAKSVKKVSGGTICSDWVTLTVMTLGDAPSISIKNATTKKLVSQMRQNKSFTIDLPRRISHADAARYVNAIRDPRPHLDKFQVSYQSDPNDHSAICSLKFKYKESKAKKANALNKKLMKIVRGAKKKKGTRAKVKYVNKQLCKTCTYHWAAYRSSKGYSKYPNAYNAYGCLVQHKAVCSGYTDAFAAIMTELNIKNGYGHSPNHIWNKVKIGKRWYHVDVTWNDCTHSSKYLLKKSHPKN